MYANSWIPNIKGYKLLVVLHDNSEHETIVECDKDGMHYLKDFRISQVKGWKKLDNQE